MKIMMNLKLTERMMVRSIMPGNISIVLMLPHSYDDTPSVRFFFLSVLMLSYN